MRYAELARQNGVPAIVARGHLEYTARAADVCIAVGPSNVLVAAALGGCAPVTIPLRGYGFPTEPPYNAQPDEQDISKTVNPLLSNREAWEAARGTFIARYAYREDGKARARAVKFLVGLASA